MAWAQTYKALFGRRLLDDDVREWERMLDAAFKRGVDRSWEDEIVPALEAISEDMRTKGKARHAPDFGMVKSAIIRKRYADRGDREAPREKQPGEHDCPFCRDSGAMTWYPAIKPPYPSPDSQEWIVGVWKEQIYCQCGKGNQLAIEAGFKSNPKHKKAQEQAAAQYRARMGEPEPKRWEEWEPE